MTNDYERSFSRNIGVITKKEQDIIKKSTVAVAGLGGIGGVTASILARMGFMHFKIADIDTFDIQNLNRQAASTHSVLGQPKVDVIDKMIKDINPQAKIEIYNEGVQPHNVIDFINDVDVVVDAIDFFCFTARDTLQKACHKESVPVVFSAPLGMTATLLFFTPRSMSYQEYFDFSPNQDRFEKLIRFNVGIAPSALHLKHMNLNPESLIEIETGPSLSPSVHLGGATIAIEILKYLTAKGKVCEAPHYQQIDLFKGNMVRKKLFRGNKNPKQQLKIYLANKMYGKYKQELLAFIK